MYQKIIKIILTGIFILHLGDIGLFAENNENKEKKNYVALNNTTNSTYANVNAKTSYRKRILQILNEIQAEQFFIKRDLQSTASKAGARTVLKLLRDLVDEQVKFQENITSIQNNIENINAKLPQINKLNELNELNKTNKNLQEKYNELNQTMVDIKSLINNLQNNFKNFSKVKSEVEEIQTILKTNYEDYIKNINDISGQITSTKKKIQNSVGNFPTSLFYIFTILIFVVLGFMGYILWNLTNSIKTVQRDFNTFLADFSEIRNFGLDNSLTADDLYQMAENVKMKAMKLNWEKRKVEDKPPFI